LNKFNALTKEVSPSIEQASKTSKNQPSERSSFLGIFSRNNLNLY